MSKKSVFGGDSAQETGIVNSNTTVYRLVSTSGSRQETSTEANSQRPIHAAGTLSLLGANVTTNAHTATLTYRTRINAANGTLILSIGAGTTGQFQDSTHSDSLASNDLLAIAQTVGASDAFNNFAISLYSLVLDATSALAMYHGTCNRESDLGASSTAYGQFCMTGTTSPGWYGHTTENGQVQQELRAAGTLQQLRTYISSNTSANATTYTLRKNGADATQTISIGASTTGAFVDTTHTDAVVATDTFNWKWATGSGTSNARSQWVGVEFLPSSTQWDSFAGGGWTGATNALSTSVDSYLPLIGGFPAPFDTTESKAQWQFPVAVKFSNLRLYQTNGGGGSGTQTLTFRKNGANGSQTVSVTAGTTGLYEDSTHSDTIAQNDLVNAKLTHPSGGTVVPSRLGVLIDNQLTQSATATADIGTITLTAPEAEAHLTVLASAGIGTITLTPPHARARVSTPDIQADMTQLMRQTVAEGSHRARATQIVRQVVGAVTADARATQVMRQVVGETVPSARTTQVLRQVIADSVSCVTSWCQCWTITRRDGRVFRYTSLDEDFTWGADVYKACGSLMPSASQDASQLGQVSNQELQGVLKDDEITEADLYGGLFDDATVEVWLVDYAGTDSPRRLAAGWTGNLQHQEGTFNMEVLGPGAKLDQQALVQVYGPGCRWVFGSPECGKDREALKVTCHVSITFNRAKFFAEVGIGSSGTGAQSDHDAAAQWENGLVRWTSGRNAGLECEVKTAVFDAGDVAIELWELAGFMPEADDTFELLPGCDLAFDGGCTVYNNRINFGGFKDVPGEDAIMQTPDAKLS